jgi:hypothetical protein
VEELLPGGRSEQEVEEVNKRWKKWTRGLYDESQPHQFSSEERWAKIPTSGGEGTIQSGSKRNRHQVGWGGSRSEGEGWIWKHAEWLQTILLTWAWWISIDL